MMGRIYSDQKCPVCGGIFVYDGRRSGLFCRHHPEQMATRRFRVRFGKKTHRRFKNYQEAERFLNGLRYEFDKGVYDPRDYQKGNPLGFAALADKWLQIKQKEVRPKSYNNLRNYMDKAKRAWGQTNIKAIGFGEIEDFLFSQDVSDKTRSNMRSCLHSFWVWLKKRRVISLKEFPEFPEISYELGWRKITDKENQEAIIEEIRRLTYHINPKIWLGIKWLSTYISIRPGELLNLKEQDINIKLRCFIIPHPKEKKPKLVPMLEEDIEILKNMPIGLPDLPFFRHVEGVRGCKPGQPFGKKYFYKWWKKACANLRINDLDLYGGTKHTTTTALGEVFSPEQIKRGSLHSTNKAFDRYLQAKAGDALKIYHMANQLTNRGQPVANKNSGPKSANILKFK
jgi:integrase